jgi:hypothetical protein
MILEDELSIRFFNVLIGGVPGHTEDRIIIFSYHGADYNTDKRSQQEWRAIRFQRTNNKTGDSLVTGC